MIAKSKRPQAERAGEWAVREHYDCVATRRAVSTRFQKQDLFAADIIGLKPDGTKVFAQVTAGGNTAVSVRRKKLEAYPWHPTDTVLVLQMVERQDVANQRRTAWWFRVHEYALVEAWFGPFGRGLTDKDRALITSRKWQDVTNAIEIKPGWFKAWREEA